MVQSPVEISSKTLSFAEYLVDEGKPGVWYELDRGQSIEMPTTTGLHNKICEFLTEQFRRYFCSQNLSLVAKYLTGVRTEEKTLRIPDVVVCTESLWDKVCDRKCAAVLDFDEKPCLVVEETGENGRSDYIRKRAEYDGIGIPEYWIVDPDRSRIGLCSKFSGEEFLPGDEVQSVQFSGLTLPVNRVLSPPLVEESIREEQKLRQQLKQLAASAGQRLQDLGIDADTIN